MTGELLFGKLEAAAQATALQLGKKVYVELHGGATAIPKKAFDAFSTGLIHAVRNSMDHGQATAIVGILEVDAGKIFFSIRDNGRGPDYSKIVARAHRPDLVQASIADRRQLLELLFEPGFTTREGSGAISGRGVGLEAVREAMRAVGGDACAMVPEAGGFELRMWAPFNSAE